MKITKADLEEKFKEYAAACKLKIDYSRFEGRKYHIAKPGTIFLENVDIRLGNGVAISSTVSKGGGVSVLVGYISPSELYYYMVGFLAAKSKKKK